MKIISGELKGRNFYLPAHIRPTQNIVRKAVFDLIGHDLSGLTFLDLFAGSGAIGFEAISNKAAQVTFVERDSKCFEVLQQNISHLKIIPYMNRPVPYALINNDAFASLKLLARQKRKFDIVFADPPYGRELAKIVIISATGKINKAP